MTPTAMLGGAAFCTPIIEQIETCIALQPEPKQTDIRELHRLILNIEPGCNLWFLDGRNEEGKFASS